MSSEFDQYFQEFLADDYNEFDIFKDDFSSEPAGLHHADGRELQDRAVSRFDPTPLEIPSEDIKEPSLTSKTADSALWRDLLLPESDSSTRLAFFF